MEKSLSESGFDVTISFFQNPEDYYLVQFDGPIEPSDKRLLRNNVSRIYGYVPDYAFLVKMSAFNKSNLSSRDGVRWVGPYQSSYRVQPGLKSFEGTEEIEVVTFPGEGPNQIADGIKDTGAEVLNVSSGDLLRVRASESQVGKIAALDGVRWIERYSQPKLFNDTARWVIQSGESGYTPIHDNGLRGENQIVAIADSGLRTSHEMFYDSSNSIGTSHRKILSYYVPEGADGAIGDEEGHGTHVAGSVAGDALPYGSYNDYDGQGFQAKLEMQDIDNVNDGYVYPPPDLTNLFRPACENGARIHSNSWGGGDGYGSGSVMIDNFMWNNKDFQILYAMGNSGSSLETLSVQAEAKNVISVGATGNGSNSDNIADFSSRGPAEDNRIKPTVVAPGVDIRSADYSGDSKYTDKSGTSMSTPTVAGALSLIEQYYENGWYVSGDSNPSEGFQPSSALLRATLISGAEEIGGSGAYYHKNAYPNPD